MAVVRVPYQPNPGQEQFHAFRYAYVERLLGCGTAGGKTVAGSFDVLNLCLENPGSTWLVGEPTVPMLEKAMYPAWAIMLGEPLGQHPLTRDWNMTKKRLRLPNGSTIWFVGLDDPLNIEGPPEVDGVWVDEGRVVRRFAGPDGAWLQMTRRLRKRSDGPRHAILTTHSQTREIAETFRPVGEPRVVKTGHKLNLANGGVHEAAYGVQRCADPDRVALSWSPFDSAAWGTLSPRDAQRIASQYHGGDYERIILGKYARPSNAVYEAFDPGRHVRPAPIKQAAQHVTYGVDLGWTHRAVVTVHYWLGSSVHTVDEDAIDKAGVGGIAESVKRLYGRHGDGVVHVGTDVRPSETVENLKEAGIQAEVATGRVEDGVFVLNSRLQAGTWLIDPRCEELLRNLDAYHRDPATLRIVDEDNDAADSARYGIVGAQPIEARVYRRRR